MDKAAAEAAERRVWHLLGWALLLLLLGGAAAFLSVGHHRHAIELRQATATPRAGGLESGAPLFRITSRRSPFEVVNPRRPDPEPVTIYGGTLHYKWSTEVQSASLGGRGWIHSRQVVELPQHNATATFTVNGIELRLLPDGVLEAGKRRWQARPGDFVEVSIDELEQPQPPQD